MAEKLRGKTGDAASRSSNSDPEPGHLGVDDRGNVTWDWNGDGDLLADDTLGAAERVQALVDPALVVTEEEEDPDNPLNRNPKGLKSGYNPYNSGALGKQSWKKKKNLKELSQWIELRKKIAEKKDEE
jgi:hypothetical protein